MLLQGATMKKTTMAIHHEDKKLFASLSSHNRDPKLASSKERLINFISSGIFSLSEKF